MASMPVVIRRYARLLPWALLALALALLLLSLPPAGAQTIIDYDDDNDGLIDIRTPAQLDAVRHDPDGNGDATHADYVSAFPDRQTTSPGQMGCPTADGCTGYELRANIDLSGDANWTPLTTYTATFEGNGHTISNLTIGAPGSGSTAGAAGLFSQLSTTGRIQRVGVVGANVYGGGGSSQELGILVGQNNGIIRFSYATGQVTSNTAGAWHKTGGLVGHLQDGGSISASYSTAAVTGPTTAGTAQATGGLVGMIGDAGSTQNGTITASYASGAVHAVAGSTSRTGGLVGFHRHGNINQSYSYGGVTFTGTDTSNYVGGLVGNRETTQGIVTDSYYDRETSGRSDTGEGDPKTTRELQTPTGYDDPYAAWNVDVDGEDGADDPWDFGTSRHYPALKIDFNGDGRATCREFGPQRCYREPGPPPYNPAADHPEIYANARTGITAACSVETTGTGEAAITTATLTFNLAEYTRPITLALSLWDRTHFRSLQSLGIAMPTLQRDGQTATVEVATDPARTRFRLDGQYGLNLVLGYADCHTDDP